jgi:hypothetical protein
VIVASGILGAAALTAALILWVAPRWALYGALAALLPLCAAALFTLLGGFSAQSSASLLDVATLAAAPAAFIVLAPLLTLVRKLQLRARERRDAERQDEELARFRN